MGLLIQDLQDGRMNRIQILRLIEPIAKPQVTGPFRALEDSKRGWDAPFTVVLQLALISDLWENISFTKGDLCGGR